MDSREFQFYYYFNKYLNYPVTSRDSFRNMFIHEHGQYEDLDLLIIAIEKYQIKKYGEALRGMIDHRKEKRKGGR